MPTNLTIFLLAVLLASSCKPRALESQALAANNVITNSLVEEVVVALRAHQKNSLGEWSSGYQDDSRVKACFLNPAGEDLSAWQKTVYCHTPLEYRLCLTPKVIDARKEFADINERVAHLSEVNIACQKKTDELLEGGGSFFLRNAHPDADHVLAEVFFRGIDPDGDANTFLVRMTVDTSGNFPAITSKIVFQVLRDAVSNRGMRTIVFDLVNGII